jgi:hypothetical protein
MKDPKNEFVGYKKIWLNHSKYKQIKKYENKFIYLKYLAWNGNTPILAYIENVKLDEPMIWIGNGSKRDPPQYIELQYLDMTGYNRPGYETQIIRVCMNQKEYNNIWVKPLSVTDQILMKLKYEEVIDGFDKSSTNR